MRCVLNNVFAVSVLDVFARSLADWLAGWSAMAFEIFIYFCCWIFSFSRPLNELGGMVEHIEQPLNTMIVRLYASLHAVCRRINGSG